MKQVISLKKKTLWDSRDKNVDNVGKENAEMNSKEITHAQKIKNPGDDKEENKTGRSMESDNDDIVSGFLYDRLQKEVICLRKFCETKESALNTKDEEIKVKYYHKTKLYCSYSS